VQISLRREGDELWIRIPQAGTSGSWSRWALPSGAPAGIHLSPGLPDRLLVVKPQTPFHLTPGATARIYVRVPVRVAVRVGSAAGPILVEFPTLRLSDTWWGDMEDGALGYWLSTHARRVWSADLEEPHMAVCTMTLSNRSREALPVEKIALRVAHLSLFSLGNALWCDEVGVTYGGGDESDVEMSGSPPEEALAAQLLVPPRNPAERSFSARTFARILGRPGGMG
jgi:hypothetical protein